MRYQLIVSLSCIAGLIACSSSNNGLFKKGTPHEVYTQRINDAKLSSTALGQAWMQASAKALLAPLSITVPFREKGFFDKTEPTSTGYRFKVRRGQVVNVSVSKKALTSATIFSELWYMPDSIGSSKDLLQSIDSTVMKQEVKKDGYYILHIQPELLVSAEYNCEIFITPSLGFPVATQQKATVGSFWGDARDAGARSHEGIDIFGKLRTPVVAASNATVNRVGNNNLGGKVIFLRPDEKDFSLYYAHLDSQLVKEGERVTTGQVIGLMGKTGNARNTPVHLHFGIYTRGGAIDPLPFIKTEPSLSGEQIITDYFLNENVVTKSNSAIQTDPQKNTGTQRNLATNTILKVIGVNGKLLKIKLPDESEGYVMQASVKKLQPLESFKAKDLLAVKEKPFDAALTKTEIRSGTNVEVLGYFDTYYYVNVHETSGWLKRN